MKGLDNLDLIFFIPKKKIGGSSSYFSSFFFYFFFFSFFNPGVSGFYFFFPNLVDFDFLTKVTKYPD